MIKSKNKPESIKYLEKMQELMKLGADININARLIHLKRIIEVDLSSKPSLPVNADVSGEKIVGEF